jgi:hypothetical protein
MEMSVNATQLVGRLNFVLSSRRLKQKGYIEEYLPIPATTSEEEEITKEMMFAFIKKLFPGCKIRANANSFSLRLDGHIHRKANKIREIYANEREWREFFERQHRNLYNTMRANRQSFQSSGMVERRVVDDKVFLYIPFTPNRIYGYVNYGIQEFCQWLENEYKKDEQLATNYENIMRLMEEEIARKERERLERIERELREYKEQIMRELFKPVTRLQESENAVDRLFAAKFSEWARENGKAPEYAAQPTAKEMVPRGLKVKIMAPPGSEEEGWIALPPFEGYVEPEGFEMQGWGKVTSIDMTSDRARRGQSPVVVQEYLYTEFHLEHWEHLLPEGYAELAEVSHRLRREAEAEVEPWLEQERIQKEREEAERREAEAERRRIQEEERRQVEEQIRRQVEEEEARARAAEERRAALAEQLRQQLASQPQPEAEEAVEEAPPQAITFEDFLAGRVGQQQRQQATPFTPEVEPERANATGLYRNGRAIPLERYVAINENGQTRRFHNAQRAAAWMGYTGVVTIRDYHVPHDTVEAIQVETGEDPTELPF